MKFNYTSGEVINFSRVHKYFLAPREKGRKTIMKQKTFVNKENIKKA